MNTETVTEANQARQGFREDGRVDVDAVRAGTPDLSDAPALYESLCDEVEALRATVARSRNALAELDRYQTAYLPGVRARQLVDAALAAVGGKSDPHTYVEVDEDTVHIGDGVTNASFTVSEAYTVMHGLVEGLPNGRRSLGLEGGAR
jgi:hypothetical protein